jgi:hypothetical protein
VPITEAGNRLLGDIFNWIGKFSADPEDMIAAIEAEVLAAERARIAEAVRWTNPMMWHPAAVKAVGEFRAMILALLEPTP